MRKKPTRPTNKAPESVYRGYTASAFKKSKSDTSMKGLKEGK